MYRSRKRVPISFGEFDDGHLFQKVFRDRRTRRLRDSRYFFRDQKKQPAEAGIVEVFDIELGSFAPP